MRILDLAIVLLYVGNPSCGGSLVRKDWMVTPAHCMSGYENLPDFFTMRVGEHDRRKPEGSEKNYKVKRIIRHPGYNRYLSNDIALLQLSEDVTFTDYVKPVCLPEQDIPVRTDCYITGGTNPPPPPPPPSSTATPGRPPFCSGTLIRDNVVMTAAHCLRSTSASNYEVRIGDHNLLEGKIGPQEEQGGLSKMYIHENYNSFTKENDIALLILNKNVKIGGQVQVACLPTKPVADDAICYKIGWGNLKEGGRQPTILQEVKLPLYTNSDCKRALIRKYKITEDMICAGYHEGRKDACQGDSGGPLVCKILGTDRMELHGVTSFGDGSAKPNAPGVYSRVHHFVKNNWIKNKLRQHRMDTVENEINDLESIFEFFADAL